MLVDLYNFTMSQGLFINSIVFTAKNKCFVEKADVV